MNSKLSYTFKLLRPLNMLLVIISVYVGGAVAGVSLAAIKILLAALSASCILGAGNIVNDLLDVESDRVNHPNRALVTGGLSNEYAKYLYLSLTVIGLLLSITISLYNFIIALTATILLLFYSFKLKQIVFIGNITVSLLTGMVFLFIANLGTQLTALLYLSAFAFLINLLRECVKDIQDYEGDRLKEVESIYHRYSMSGVKVYLIITTLTLAVVDNIPFWTGLFGVNYILIINCILNPILFIALKLFLINYKFGNLKVISSLYKLSMFIGAIGIMIDR